MPFAPAIPAMAIALSKMLTANEPLEGSTRIAVLLGPVMEDIENVLPRIANPLTGASTRRKNTELVFPGSVNVLPITWSVTVVAVPPK